MRSLVSDDRYFKFLDGLNDDILVHTELAAVCLIQEFPTLRAEEAKAVWQDWRMSKRAPWKGRMTQLAIRQSDQGLLVLQSQQGQQGQQSRQSRQSEQGQQGRQSRQGRQSEQGQQGRQSEPICEGRVTEEEKLATVGS